VNVFINTATYLIYISAFQAFYKLVFCFAAGLHPALLYIGLSGLEIVIGFLKHIVLSRSMRIAFYGAAYTANKEALMMYF
jgi:hypothetical protein